MTAAVVPAEQILDRIQQIKGQLYAAAVEAYTAGVGEEEVSVLLSLARRVAGRAIRRERVRAACPSSAAYRRHLRRGEHCPACSAENARLVAEWRAARRRTP